MTDNTLLLGGVCVCLHKLDVNWRQINSHKSFKTVCLMVLARGLTPNRIIELLFVFPKPSSLILKQKSKSRSSAIHGVLINSPVWQGCSLLCCFVFFYRHKLTPPPRPPPRKKEPFKSCRQRSIQTELWDQRHCRVTFDPTVPQGFAKQQKPVLYPSQPDKNMTGNYQFIQRMKTSQEKIGRQSWWMHFFKCTALQSFMQRWMWIRFLFRSPLILCLSECWIEKRGPWMSLCCTGRDIKRRKLWQAGIYKKNTIKMY